MTEEMNVNKFDMDIINAKILIILIKKKSKRHIFKLRFYNFEMSPL